ncbi:DNA polymerase beta palm [Ceratobasidium sp. AG-Ba]|nr:DNA polymerase beta palm [Ceratobasidium sp. AG-Ba]
MPKARRSPSPSTSPCATPPAESQILAGLTIHVVNAKLSPPEIGEMFTLARNAGAKLSSAPQNASVLITALTMRRRLERHISWDVASTKHIVSPQWLRACVAQDKLLPFSPFETIKSERRVSGPAYTSGIASLSTSSAAAGPSRSKPAASAGDYTHPLSTHRRCPLVCPNQALCQELAIIMKSRFLEGEVNNELAYSRAIAIIKSYPKVINDAEEIRKLPGIGPKVTKYVDEFLKKGSIAEARETVVSKRFQTLSQFASIHSIGTAKAREHYDAGCRNIEDLIEVYRSMKKGKLVNGILAALELRDELAIKIPRSEVEATAQTIYKQLSSVQDGCEYMICGSYRRGKEQHDDIDFIFTHPNEGTEKHLCERLVDRLKESNMVTHVLNQSSFTSNHENTHGRQVSK